MENRTLTRQNLKKKKMRIIVFLTSFKIPNFIYFLKTH